MPYRKAFSIVVLVILIVSSQSSALQSGMDATGFFADHNGTGGIWRVNCKTGEKQQILSGWSAKGVGLSPDGKQVVIDGSGGKAVVNIDGTGYTKLPAAVSLPNSEGRIWWTRLGVFNVENGTLVRRSVMTGDRTVVCSVNNPGSSGTCQVGMPGTRAFTRATSYGRTIGPKGYRSHKENYTFYQIAPDGNSGSFVSQSAWGHGEGMTTDGTYALHVTFGSGPHDGVWLRRTGDGQQVAQKSWEMGTFEARFANCANDNDWVGMTLNADAGGIRKTTLWNWRFNTQVEVPMPSGEGMRLFGFWIGNDVPEIGDDRAYIFAYRKDITIAVCGRTTPLEKTVNFTNIGGGTLGQVTATVEPVSASSWLETDLSGTGNDRTLTIRIKPQGLSQNTHTADVRLSESTARNSESVKVTADRTMLPEPGNFVVTSANPTDSFEYALLTWEDNAESEAGYVIEHAQNLQGTGPARKPVFVEVARVGANATRFIGQPRDGGNGAYYRVRAFDNQGHFSPEDAEWGNFQSLDLKLEVIAPAANSSFSVGDSMVITWRRKIIQDFTVLFTVDKGVTWDTIVTKYEQKDSLGTCTWTIPQKADNKAVYVKVQEWPIAAMWSMTGLLKVGSVNSSDTGLVAIDGMVNPRVGRLGQSSAAITVSVLLTGASAKLVVAGAGEGSAVRIIDTRGKTVLRQALPAGHAPVVDLRSLVPGLYVARVSRAGMALHCRGIVVP